MWSMLWPYFRWLQIAQATKLTFELQRSICLFQGDRSGCSLVCPIVELVGLRCVHHRGEDRQQLPSELCFPNMAWVGVDGACMLANPPEQYPLTCMHTSSFLWASMISWRRWAVAGSWSTVEQAKVSTSSQNCTSDVLWELTGARESASAEIWRLPGTCKTSGLYRIIWRRKRSIRGGIVDKSVVVRSGTSGLWSVSRVNLSPRTYSSRRSHAQVEASTRWQRSSFQHHWGIWRCNRWDGAVHYLVFEGELPPALLTMHLQQWLFDGWGCNVQGSHARQASLWLAGNAVCWASSQYQALSLWRRCRKGVVMSARPGTNFPSLLTMPMNLCSSVTVVGVGKWPIARVFSGSAWTPWASTMCPRNLSLPCENSHFWMFNVRPALWRRTKTAQTRASCSIWFLPWIRMSPIQHMTPSRPSKMSDMVHWNISGAELIPKGRRLKQERPKGGDKGGQQFWVLIQRNLPEPAIGVWFREYSAFTQHGQALISRAHGMSFTLHRFVQWCQVYTDPYMPIRFGDRNNAGAPLCGNSNRWNDALSKHRINFVFHFRQQWVRYFPWSVEADWLYIWVKLDVIFSFQFPQTMEELRNLSNEIHWLSVHLSNSSD